MQSIPDSRPERPIQHEVVAAARLFAAIAIVWLHTFVSVSMTRFAEVGRFAVPFFTLMAIALLVVSLRRRPDRNFGDYFKSRIVRLYLPFVGWAVISIAAADLKRHFLTHKPPAPLSVFTLLTGGSLQLWFLPFILLAGLAVFPVARAVARQQVPAGLTCACAMASGLLLLFLRFPLQRDAVTAWQADLFYWLAMSWGALPSVFFGLVVGIACTRGSWPAGTAPAGLAVMAVSMLAYLAYPLTAFPTLAGIGLGLAALAAGPVSSFRWCLKWSFLAYGIYLAHVLFLESIQAMLSHWSVRPSVTLEIGVFLATLALSAATCVLLNASKYTRWLLG